MWNGAGGTGSELAGASVLISVPPRLVTMGSFSLPERPSSLLQPPISSGQNLFASNPNPQSSAQAVGPGATRQVTLLPSCRSMFERPSLSPPTATPVPIFPAADKKLNSARGFETKTDGTLA